MNENINQGPSYDIEKYTVKELMVILKSFFKLDFESIENHSDLMKQINISINDYKRKYNNIQNVLFFENARDKIDNYLLNRPYSLRHLLNINENNDEYDYLKLEDENDERKEMEEMEESEEDNIQRPTDSSKYDPYISDMSIHAYANAVADESDESSKNYNLPSNVNELTQESLSKLYDTFNMEYKSLSLDTLEDSYTTLKTKIMQLNSNSTSGSSSTVPSTDQMSLLKYINASYQLLRKYIINKLYGNEFTNTNYELLNNKSDLTLNENRYDLLSTPNVIENNQSQIIQKNTSASQEVYINEVPKDVLNPIKRTEIKSIVNIDTFLRSDYLNTNPSDYVQEFAEPINNVLSMALSSIEMPNIWYIFSQERSSNYFNINFRNFNFMGNTYDVSYDIIIPDGNYTSEEITTTLNNLFKYYAQNNPNPNLPNEYMNPIYYLRFAVDNITGKSTFRMITSGFDYTNADEEQLFGTSPYEEYKFDGQTENPTYSPDMIIEFTFLNNIQQGLYNDLLNRKFDPSINEIVYNVNNINSTLSETYVKNIKQKAYNSSSITPERIMFDTAGWMFGFRKPNYTITINDTFFDPYTSSSVVIYKGFMNSEGIYGGLINTYIFLSIDDFNNNYKRTVISNNEDFLVSNNILAKIPVGTGSNTLLVQEDKFNKLRQYFGPVNIKKLRIKLLDRFGNIVNLNNNNYTFTLELTQLY
jgi:hypothetical protein